MSRHRDAVLRLVERLSANTAAAIKDMDEPRDLGAATCLTIDLIGHAPPPAFIKNEVVANLRRELAVASVDDLLEADITIQLAFATRDVRCVVSGGAATVRRMHVARVWIRSRVKTRWVHMWDEIKRSVEWAQT